jgi:HAMP domain-containing protein
VKYRVEVAAPLPEDLDAAAARVADDFGIPASKVLALLARAPGIVTKPVDAAEANRVVQAFAKVGIAGRMLPYDPAAPTVLDGVLDAAGSEPARSAQRLRSATPPAPAVLPPVASVEAVPEAAVPAVVDPAPIATPIANPIATPTPTPEVSDPPRAAPETLSEPAVPAPSVGRRPAIVPRIDDSHVLDMSGLGEADLDLTDPGLGERSRRIYAALDAAIEKVEAEQAAAEAAAEAARAAAAVEDDPPLIVSGDVDDVDDHDDLDSDLPVAAEPAAEVDTGEAAPTPLDGDEVAPSAEAEVDQGFDAQAFTQALLDEHGFDDSLLDGLESEAEAFDLRDRADRLTVDEEVTAGSSRRQRSPFLSRVEEPTVGERGAIAVPIGIDDDDAETSPRSSDAGQRRGERKRRPGRRRGLRSKVLLAGLFPALLTAVFALAAVALTVRPALQAQQGAVASAAANSLAAALSTRQIDAALNSAAAAAELQRAALLARPVLLDDGIDLLLVTDVAGTPLAGWSLVSVDPQEVARSSAALLAPALEAALEIPSDGAVAAGPASSNVATAPLLVEGSVVGAVLVAGDPAQSGAALRLVLLIVAIAVLIPLLIAFVVSGALTGSLLQNLESLTRAADRISRGKLGRPVELDTGDELSDLAQAIERMRISLEEGMERLRRRRQ